MVSPASLVHTLVRGVSFIPNKILSGGKYSSFDGFSQNTSLFLRPSFPSSSCSCCSFWLQGVTHNYRLCKNIQHSGIKDYTAVNTLTQVLYLSTIL